MLTEVLSARDAAKLLGVSTRRVWQLLKDGAIHAASDEPVLLHRIDVEHLAHVQTGKPGRPIAASKAWDEIAAFSMSDFVDEGALDTWRRRIRPRATWRRFYVHRTVLRDLTESRLVVASGLRAASFHGLPVDSDPKRFIGYVDASDLDELPPGVNVESGPDWNVELGVVTNDAWRFGRSARFVDPVTTWLDLEDHRDRSARLMLETLVDTRN